ncbi:hypothetical protein DFH07DRAFT_1026479 [Mycena maculata]|uniref:NAD(P)-binding protein n=1 Tax=Mycena maculata TaxID=230809 RepID=A0AAD7NYK4_9AGAR|nr:hypothetical protein DFH07DRAFT_1026479 [Mycena maculata]
MRFSFWSFIKSQWAKQPPVVNADLTGKTVLVLGANIGIGFEAAKHFATMNPGKLILACRSQSKGQAAVEKLKAATGYAKAELWIIDLADFESVRQFADKFERDGGRLDIFVANAAVALLKYEATKNGWETSIQVNHLSTSLLALLLLPSMIKTAQEHSTLPRLVVVSSGAHYWFDIEKPVVESPEIIPRHEKYCYSELRRGFPSVLAFFDHLMELALAFTSEVGSRRLVWAALAQQDHPEKLRGEFISGFKVQEEDTLDILNKVDPRVNEIVAKYLSPTA